MSGRIVIIGGGGHALVVADAARLAGWTIAGFLDDDPGALLAREAKWLGGLTDRPGAVADGCIVALGDLPRRREVIRQASETPGPGPIVSVVHPSAVVSAAASVGRGVFIGPGAIVNPRAHIGNHAILNSAAVVEHECTIGENSHIAPGAVLGGGAAVGADTLIGLGARVLPRIRIGPYCIVGAGAVVTRDVEAGAIISGVPAKGRSADRRAERPS